jgi:hypothetical protein
MADNIKSLTSEVDMCSLVEEVMNASIAGHNFRNSPSHHVDFTDVSYIDKSSVTVICNVGFYPNWTFDTQSGAWKRILMNLLGNSLKYTSSGLIKVNLQQEVGENSVTGEQTTKVCLSVEDTGKGISADFLANHLYKPFRQEHELQPGTGLGLSIVRQLVSSIGGTVEVRSDQGSGTFVAVTASLTTSANFATYNLVKSLPSGLLSRLRGLRVGILGLGLHPDVQNVPTGMLDREEKKILALRSTLVSGFDAFGCQSVTVDSMEAVKIDIFVITEDHYQSTRFEKLPARKVPLILLCSTSSLDYRHISQEGGPIIYLSQPFGPQRLARALEACEPFCCAEPAAEDNMKPITSPGTPLQHRFFSSNMSSSVNSSLLPASSKNSRIPLEPSKTGSPRVLLVEDNAINLRVGHLQNILCPYSDKY